MNEGNAVWITGVGAVTPLGHSYDVIADNLLEGRSGINSVTGFDTSQHPSQIGAQVHRVPCPPEWDETNFGRLLKLEQTIAWCCSTGLRDSGWTLVASMTVSFMRSRRLAAI